jgi:hypothetical protein
MTPFQRWLPTVVPLATFVWAFVFYKLYPTMPGFWRATSAVMISAWSFWSLVLIAKRTGVLKARQG